MTVCTEQYFAFKQGSLIFKKQNINQKTQKNRRDPDPKKKQTLPTQGMFIRVQFPLELLKRRT